MFPPQQHSLQAARNVSRLPYRGMSYPIEGIVVGVHFPGDPDNASGREIEYDIMPSHTQMARLRNVPLAGNLKGIEDDVDIVLKPAALVIPAGPLDLNSHGPCDDTDGDRVLVQFINGSLGCPIITHLLTQPQRGRADLINPRYMGKLGVLTPGSAKGPGYVIGTGLPGSSQPDLKPRPGERMVHGNVHGTHWVLDKNGDVFIDFEAHPDPTKAMPAGLVTKKFVVQNEGKDLLRIEKTATGVQVTLGEGFGASLMSAALAEPLKTWLMTHSHPTGVGPSGTPSQTWNDNIASTKAKIASNL